jgi:dihydroorotase
MPNDRPASTTAGRLARKAEIFERRCLVNWGLHLQASVRPVRVDPALVASAKLYMARASDVPGISDPDAVEAVLRAWPRVTVHAEDGTRFPGATAGLPHDRARPREAVIAALGILEAALGRIPAGRRPRVVLCHAATVEEVAWLKRLKAEGFDLWGETCPHYLAFTAADARQAGPRLQVNPPLRDPADREALLGAVADGTIDWIASDHAPHTPAEKAGQRPPSGIAAAEKALPLLLHWRDRGVLSWRRLAEVGSARAAACYGLARRDGIRDGNAADLALVRSEPDRPTRPPVTRAGIDVYRDGSVGWKVVATLVGGVVVVQDGSFPDLHGKLPGRRVVP